MPASCAWLLNPIWINKLRSPTTQRQCADVPVKVLQNTSRSRVILPRSFHRGWLRYALLATNPKINLKSWRIFRRSIWCRLPPHFHHKSTTIYHAFHHVLRTQNRKTPHKNALLPARKKLQNIARKILILHDRRYLLAHILRIHHNHLLHTCSSLPLDHRQRWRRLLWFRRK
jgi:hypothetical protein